MTKEHEYHIVDYLSTDKNSTIIVRAIFTKDYKGLEAFSISLLSNIKGKPTEIIRFDCSVWEEVNVHRFYSNPPTKHYLNKEKSIETLQEAWENIKRNWLEYLMRYKKNHEISENNI